jgi:hypothetical protein
VTTIELALAILCIAALIGAALAVGYMRRPAAGRARPALPACHGALGAAGLAVLLAALGRGLPRSVMGTAGFGCTSAALFVLALVLGLGIARAAWRGRRPAGALVGAHAAVAIAGLVVLSALLALG